MGTTDATEAIIDGLAALRYLPPDEREPYLWDRLTRYLERGFGLDNDQIETLIWESARRQADEELLEPGDQVYEFVAPQETPMAGNDNRIPLNNVYPSLERCFDSPRAFRLADTATCTSLPVGVVTFVPTEWEYADQDSDVGNTPYSDEEWAHLLDTLTKDIPTEAFEQAPEGE